MKYYLAFDPGTNTGWARFNDQGFPILWGVLKGHDALMDFLEKITDTFGGNPEEFIYEDYRYDPRKRQGGRRPVAGIAIGHIENYARRHNIPIIRTQPKDLPVGLRWAGLEKPKGHLPDWMSAVAHGTYSLQNRGIRKSNLALKIEAEKLQNGTGTATTD